MSKEEQSMAEKVATIVDLILKETDLRHDLEKRMQREHRPATVASKALELQHSEGRIEALCEVFEVLTGKRATSEALAEHGHQI